MANKNKSQKNRRQRKNKTLRGGGMFDWLTGSTTETATTTTSPNKSWSEWFGISSAPKATSVTAEPAPAPVSVTTNPVTEEQKKEEVKPVTGGKRKNKSNKNKNRKNKH